MNGDGHVPINLSLQKESLARGLWFADPTLDFYCKFRTHTLNIDNAVKIQLVNKDFYLISCS